jgi:hypothetical protein
VDEHLHPTESGRPLSQCIHRRPGRNIGHLFDDLVALGPQLLGRRLQRTLIDVGQHQRGTGAEPTSDGQAHSPDAGHHDDSLSWTHPTVPLAHVPARSDGPSRRHGNGGDAGRSSASEHGVDHPDQVVHVHQLVGEHSPGRPDGKHLGRQLHIPLGGEL